MQNVHTAQENFQQCVKGYKYVNFILASQGTCVLCSILVVTSSFNNIAHLILISVI